MSPWTFVKGWLRPLDISGGFCLFSNSVSIHCRRNWGHFDEILKKYASIKKSHWNCFSSVVSVQFLLHLMPRYVSLFSSTISLVSFTQRQWISYQLISIYCVFVKKNWELNKFLNLKLLFRSYIEFVWLCTRLFEINCKWFASHLNGL